ncbi:Retrovirus-related Pol poly from transposon [Paramuricea clavata]|uniref:Retrovirus-related Pol poly from transposon n=1 Tax=Paramuricea clavata TaxID=317549 RepID=A0A6S7J9W0_PARCT|nr:Retrovirus-related Pol poly from transposon [Paramuricea clavata]
MPAGASKLKVVDIVKAQHEDATIARVLQLLKTSHKPSVTEIRRETPQVRKYLCKWHQLKCEQKERHSIPERTVGTTPQSSGGYQYILVVVDHFTKYSQAYPTKNKSCVMAADRIFNDFIQRFGVLKKIDHDMGMEFENNLFKRLEQLTGVMLSDYTIKRKVIHDQIMCRSGKVRYTDLQPGDCVLVRNLSPRGGPGKLQAFWEEVHIVVSRKGPESPVYELRPETGRGRNRVLHRNLLLPCEHLPLENWHELTRKTTETQRATKRVPRNESEDERLNSD